MTTPSPPPCDSLALCDSGRVSGARVDPVRAGAGREAGGGWGSPEGAPPKRRGADVSQSWLVGSETGLGGFLVAALSGPDGGHRVEAAGLILDHTWGTGYQLGLGPPHCVLGSWWCWRARACREVDIVLFYSSGPHLVVHGLSSGSELRGYPCWGSGDPRWCGGWKLAVCKALAPVRGLCPELKYCPCGCGGLGGACPWLGRGPWPPTVPCPQASALGWFAASGLRVDPGIPD